MASPVPPLELPELHLEPSAASTEFESADESLASARGSLTARRRSSEAGVSRASSSASAAHADTASSPERRPSSRLCASVDSTASPAGGALSAVAEVSLADQMAEISLAEDPKPAPSAVQMGSPAQAEQQQQEQQAPAPASPPPAQQQQQQVQPPAAAAAPRSPPPPGAALFSVPSASAPTTGIYGIPQEMFRIRDLDAGREYSLDQRYWIKDMDTGNVYVLEAEEEGVAGASGSGRRSAGGAPAGEGRVTELLSGRELSLNEFEDALGFFKVPQPAPMPAHALPAPGEGGGGGAAAAGAAVQLAAQRSLRSFTTGATWVKASVGGMLSNLKQGSPRGGTGGPEGSGPFLGTVSPCGGSGSSPPPSLAFDDRQGQPVKVQVYRKSYKEMTDLRLVQQLGGHQGVVWTMKFSRNGRYLATAGQDCMIRVWEVSPSRGSLSAPSTPVESEVPLDDLSGTGSGSATPAAGPLGGGTAGGGGAAAPAPAEGPGALADPLVEVFQQRPCRVYRGHKQDVLDLCWSKTQFLLSASMDKTVRLWHVSMDECLRVFKHTDFVTAIDFHPLDDKMFLSGSIDGKVRLWNIPEQRVVSWQDVHEMVTAVTYSPDGRKAVVGTMKGKCRFYTIEKNTLEYEAQLDVKNKRGQHSRGKKVTGLSFLPGEPGKLLITSNDSRIRLYDGYTLRCKYKGHTNRNTQIRASFSPGGDYISCGSDDGWVYVWGTRKSDVPPSGPAGGGGGAAAAAGASFQQQRDSDSPLSKEKNASYECFQANGDIVTVAIFAPASCHRSAESMSPSADALRHQRSNSLEDRADGEAALAMARARGQVLVTAGYTGEIKMYENIGLPQWL
ncbi:signal transducer [Micractinium conductrix]|uniref:Signal transducer n=1 Tax=Micractinium conductrix TaxID=554055 RepID=A0A2P6VKF9_9CHLO|nr:signal transducer [Micractinium conductrix]|eukprot:PSC74579.1 signal transducer [Micractinium conductrix]